MGTIALPTARLLPLSGGGWEGVLRRTTHPNFTYYVTC